MKFHLFRHGQTDWNAERRVQGQSESRLTEVGIQQAKELGRRIRNLKFDRVFCSSSLRTRETADHAFSHSGMKIEYQDKLREIFMGPWEGRLYESISDEDPDSFHHFWNQPQLFRVEGAETFAELQERALTALAEIHQRFRETEGVTEIAIVSHGAFIKSILCRADDLPLSDLWAPPHMHNCAHSIVEFENPDSIRILQYADQPCQDLRTRT